MGLEIYKYTYTDVPGKLYGMAFAGKGNKPIWHVQFSSPAALDRKVEETIDSYQKAKDYKDQKRQQRKEFKHDFKAGDILVSSWGYDQTNVDFYQVNKNERIRVAVPVVLVGEAPAAKLKNAIIEQLISELEVESLPGELPPQIEVDITPLAAENDSIALRDLKLKKGVAVMAAPEILLVKVSAIAEEKEEAAPTAAPTEAAAAAAAPAAGKAAAEGEAPKAEKPEKAAEKKA